ncbi:uncharacterized protein LOC114286879 [Camellia sinensis]|uniref:uncharacterized protein LOC114286879 n=1 Tax=Camellia sinensis TaxID=4442 RepID=UPI001035D6F4|nr:uncharacterized protein LOC114286879 [Camellia sinensis]
MRLWRIVLLLIRMVELAGSEAQSEVPRESYLSKLTKFESNSTELDGDCDLESKDSDSADDSDSDDEIAGDFAEVRVSLSKEEKRRLRLPWRNALIVKLLGKSVSFPFMCDRLQQMWGAMGDVKVVDLGSDFFLVRLSNRDDYDHVLFDGPWVIAGHYLSIRKWRPEFRPSEASISTIAAWVRLPEIPIEYFDEEILKKVGNIIGRTIKVDLNTILVKRGKFARLCVEIDLRKPLRSRVLIGSRWQRVEYEGYDGIVLEGRVALIVEANSY